MRNRLIAVCAAVLLALTGCTPEATQPAASGLPSFTIADFPRMDGSVDGIPLAAALLQRLAGASADEADMLCDFSTMAVAYRGLVMETGPSLLLAYEPDQDTKESIAAAGVELEYQLIGKDALVFVTDRANPVTGMAADQFKAIYTGAITDWKALGGSDHPIIAYQHPEGSSSQALLQKLVSEGAELAKAPAEPYVSAGKVVDGPASYVNSADALGYTTHYYFANMWDMPEAKTLAVDGVMPSSETISDGSYKFASDFYAVFRASEPADSPVRKLVSWLQSPEGAQLVTEAGYISLIK
ncbi:MAG: substrate-binding domain-containing protein [Propionibacteriaceae bacterium]|jgi:phosphate transport system substrate-binding protein|nr:substrate-binding domain-containing protein [Propionibacteriaceae bacterium]